MWVPQAARVVRLRRAALALQGVSPSAYAVAMVFNVLLAWYGVTEHAVPVVCAGAINVVCATVIVAALLLPGRKSP